MTKLQISIVSLAVLMLLVLFFGVSTKDPEHKKVEKKRKLVATSTDINTLLLEARPNLNAQQAAFILGLETRIEEARDDSTRIALFKELSGKWYDYQYAAIAGFYAEQVALRDSTEEAWSIAGTTFMLGARQTKEEKIKTYCFDKAISAFENAYSINPQNSAHRVNLATCYAEFPPQDNPMKGILMLLEMNKENPDDVPVILSLARFGIQTGQFDKAIERLKYALELQPSNRRAICLMAQAYQGAGKEEEAKAYQQQCEQL